MYWLDVNTTSAGTSQKNFFADSASDIINLPTMTTWGKGPESDEYPDINKPVFKGSSCLIVETSDVYILDSENNWSKLGG
jgi:hypothetical protein